MWLLHLADDDQPARSHAAPQPKPRPRTDQPAHQEDPYDDDMPTVGDEVNTMLLLLLPWAISILLHMGVVLMAFFVVWSVQNTLDDEIVKPQMVEVLPDEFLVDTPDVNIDTESSDISEVDTPEPLKKTDPLGALNAETSTDIALIGVVGDAALPFGTGGGSNFFGAGGGRGGSARTIVYVVDASGSLLDSLPFVINELKESIRKLDGRRQKFAIIFFQRELAIEVPPRGLQPATAENTRKASDWITLSNNNIVPRGSSNPVAAIKQALGYKPDLIYILSDNITGSGRYAVDQEELLEMIAETKQKRGAEHTKINTIQFLYPDPLGTLKKISDEHSGIYKFIDESVVGLR